MTRWPTKNFRPDPADYDPAKESADKAGVNMNQLLQALLKEFNEDPVGRLGALKAYLAAIAAETPPRGRPKRSTN